MLEPQYDVESQCWDIAPRNPCKRGLMVDADLRKAAPVEQIKSPEDLRLRF